MWIVCCGRTGGESQIKYALAFALLLFALPVRADSGTVTVNVTGFADFNSNGNVLNCAFSFDLTNEIAATYPNETQFYPTVDTVLTNASFSSTGNMGPFTLILNGLGGTGNSSDPAWQSSNGSVLDMALESLDTVGSYIEIEMLEANDLSGGPALPQAGFDYTISEVPEASTWVMLLTGFAGLLFLGQTKTGKSANLFGSAISPAALRR
jgi:hypothetical protein